MVKGKEQCTSIKDSVQCSVKVSEFVVKTPETDRKVPEFDKKHVKKFEGHIGRNIVYITYYI